MGYFVALLFMNFKTKLINYFGLDEKGYQELTKPIEEIKLIDPNSIEVMPKMTSRIFEAIKNKDIPTLMKLMDESRVSSTDCLQNMKVNSVEGSPLEACLLIKEVAGDEASVKINGGGFAGSIICVVPKHL